MKRRILSSLMALVLVFGLLPATPATAFAEGETVPDGKAKIDDEVYATLDEALKAAQDGDTIQLGKGTYSGNTAKPTEQGKGAGKSLTFVGAGTGETAWQIQAVKQYGSDGWCDYSFKGSDRITFENMTVTGSVYSDGSTQAKDTQGLTYVNHVTLKDCVFNGRADYWGYESTTFENVTFNAPGTEASGVADGNYSLWTYTGKSYTFKNCTFNSKSGKTVNVYRHYDTGYDIVVNFEDCTFNTESHSSLFAPNPVNINDSTLAHKYFINFTGNTKTNGFSPIELTCSRLFCFGANLKGTKNNTGKTVVNFGNTTVWEGGKMVDAKAYHTDGIKVDGVAYDNGVDGANDSLYAEGYKDNAFTVPTYGEWTKNPDGSQSREGTKKCKYCGKVVTFEERKEADPIDWDVSKSKTATQLDTNTWTSDVTLSLPSAEENLASDVVFVLDGSSSASTDVVKKSLDLLGELKTAADDSGAAVNVCVVKFKRQAYKSDWFDLSKDFDAIQTAMGTKYSGGTNLHAGLLAGQEALEEHTHVAAGRKYLILVSDGSTYLYSKDGDWASDTPFTRSYYTKENYKVFAGGFNDEGLYNPSNGPEGYDPKNVARPKTTSDVAAWQAYLADVKARNETVNSEGKTGDDYDYHCNYDLNFNQVKPSDDFKSQPCEPRTANNRDMAFYYADQVWQEIKNAGYNAYSIATKDGMAGAGNADDSHCFMNYLNGGESLNFSDIQQEILYAVGDGSTVEDKMGAAFDFVPGSLKLTVGGTELQSKADGNVTYFGDDAENLSENNCRFKVLYALDADGFVWTINENVSNFAPVQLTYTVKLTTPETDPGTYGVEDLNGEKTLSGAEAEKALFTNERAVLNAKNSAGVPVEKQEFPKPSVSYTISSGIGGDDGDDDDYFAIQKVDAQDGHALNGATFELYQYDSKGKTVNRTTAKTSRNGSESGIALFSVDNKNSYDGIWYYAEVTAPEGYVLDSTEHKITAKDFSDSRSTAVKYADTVRNYRGTTPDLLNDSDHFAYVIGYKDGNVRPYGLISRAETTTIFFRLLKDSVRDGNLLTSNTYTDVADDYWANTAISTMTGLGIVQGRSADTFDPKAPITRAQFAAICARFDTGKSSGTQTFTDIKGHWAEKYIERAAELGWIKGFEDGTFRPDTYITRAQAMTMINRVLNRIPEENSDLLAGMNTWPDCTPSDWFYLAVQEATNSHDFKHKAGNYETWTGMNKNPDWTRYEH